MIPTAQSTLEVQLEKIGSTVETVQQNPVPTNNFRGLIAEKLDVDLTRIDMRRKNVNSFMSKGEQGDFKIVLDHTIIAGFSLVTLPGCCGIVVSTFAWVSEKHRSRGLGTILNLMRQQIAFNWGYPLMLCTALVDHEPQQKILANNQWSIIQNFLNTRTNNTINIHTIQVKDTGIILNLDWEWIIWET